MITIPTTIYIRLELELSVWISFIESICSLVELTSSLLASFWDVGVFAVCSLVVSIISGVSTIGVWTGSTIGIAIEVIA